MLRRSPLANQSPRTIEQRAVREKFANDVMRRDRWACKGGKIPQVIHGGRLDVHHVGPVSRFPELRFVVDNGVVLCRMCHQWVHTHPSEAVALGLLR